MKKKVRIVLKIFIFLLSCIILIATYFFWVAKKNAYSVFQNVYSGYLSQKVEVHRDNYGVPYIHAYNAKDAYFTLGYVHASERLFQMQLFKYIFSGRVSELIGKKGLEVDTLYRTLGLKKKASKWFSQIKKTISPQDYEILDAYTNGVNEFIAEGSTPLEFKLLGLKPEPVEIEDMFGIIAFVTFGFSEAITMEPIISSLEADIKKDKLDQILMDNISKSTFILENSNKLTSLSSQIDRVKELTMQLGVPILQGSNSWVVGPNATGNGSAILCNDPHIYYSSPAIWFEAYIEYPENKLYGFFLPMVPFALAGRNENVSWGLTMFPIDDLDMYFETLNPDDPNQILFKGKPGDIITREETIYVRFGEPEKIRIKETIHGTIINSILKTKTFDKPIALKWPIFDKNNNPLKTFSSINRAKNIEDFSANLSSLHYPSLNISYADKEGNIAYWGLGSIKNKTFMGDRILDGASGLYEWNESLPFESANPKLKNPVSGIIFNANNRPSKVFSSQFYGYWQADDRANRLSTIFSDRTKWTMDSLEKITTDDVFESADSIIQTVSKGISDIKKNALSQDALFLVEVLERWDRKGNIGSMEAAFFSELRYFLAREIFIDELGEERFMLVSKTSRILHFLKRTLLAPDSQWWDDVRTKEIETKEDILVRIVNLTVESLKQKNKKSFKEIKWGDLHQLEFKHPFSYIPVLGYLFKIGPYPIGGGRETINNQVSSFYLNDHKPKAGPSMRFIADMGTDEMRIINPIGNSGHIFSPNFGDQTLMYTKGEFRKQNFKIVKNLSTKKVQFLVPKIR
jgi:penicillin G amidase